MMTLQSKPIKISPHLWALIILGLITILTFISSLKHEFAIEWDDQYYVTWNQAAWGFSIENLRQAFSTYYVGNYAPLHIVSYMLDTTLWGLRPAGFIATNLLLHLMSGCLYYLLVFRLTFNRVWAFAAAAIFLLHPVQVESVVWVSQRKNVLSMMFFMLSLHLYISYKERTGSARLYRYWGSIALFVSAALSKSVVVILPFVLAAYDICYLKPSERGRWLLDKVPYFIAALLIGIVSLISQSSEHGGGASKGWHGGSPLGTFYTMLPIMIRYLGMLFWPTKLSAFYGYPEKSSPDAEVIGAAFLLLCMCAAACYLARTNRQMFFWVLLMVLGILPVSQIIPLVTMMNDRYLYFPMLGAAALVTGLFINSFSNSGEAKRWFMISIMALVIACLSFLSYNRAKVWQDSYTLWSDAHEKFPSNPLPCFGLGSIHMQRGELEKARDYFLQAYQLGMKTQLVVLNLGRVYLSLGELDQAKLYIEALTKKYPDYHLGQMLLGDYYRKIGNDAGAAEAYGRVTKIISK